jgi:GTPase
MFSLDHSKPRILVLQVITKRQKLEDAAPELAELGQLVDTYGGEIIKEFVQRRDRPDPSFYIGTGKVPDLKQWCEAEEIDIVIINAKVKPGQLFRLEKELWAVDPQIKVWDRIDLILNIFDQHATTTESKLQIQLARVSHMGPRIYGLGKTELSRQGGGVGTRGKGETNIEFERRQIKSDQQRIKKDLKKILKQKENRISKRRDMGIGPVALVGYTSAGKTTLFNTLTGKDKQMHKGLFTTLDTVVGKMKSADYDKPILISDTIGFISKLPPVLIESFKSTLLESLEARLILHVIDASDPMIFKKIAVVEGILRNLKANQTMMMVFNKTDLMSEEELTELKSKISEITTRREQSENYDPDRSLGVMYISANTGMNIPELKSVVTKFFHKK